MSVAKSYSTPAERPVHATTSPLIAEVVDPIEEDLKELKALLEQSVNTIKRKATDLSVGRIRKLLELEVSSKNRKGLKTFLDEFLAKHAKSVLGSVGDEDTGEKLFSTGAGQIGSGQVTDVEESDLTQVVLNPLKDIKE